MSTNGEVTSPLSPKTPDNKRSLLSKLSKFSTSTESQSSTQTLKSSGSSSGLLNKQSKRFQTMTSQDESYEESRNFSRSISQTSNSDLKRKFLGGSKELLLEEPLIEDPDGTILNDGSSSNTNNNKAVGMKYEQSSSVSAASKRTINSDGTSTEHTTASNRETRKVQKGGDAFEENISANVARERKKDADGVVTEKTAGIREEQQQLKLGDTVRQQQKTAQALQTKIQNNDITTEKLETSQEEKSRLISQNMVQQQKRNLLTAQNYKVSSKGKTISSSSQSQRENYTSPLSFPSPINSTVYLAITQGVDDDIKFLNSSDPFAESDSAKERFGNRLSTCVENLQSASYEEANLLLNGMADMLKKAWLVPNLGHDLGYAMCKTLRTNGGLDLVLKHFTSNNADLQLSSAKLLEQCLSTDNREYVLANDLPNVVEAAKNCSNKKSVQHTRAGTAILEHLFKHSEDACSNVVKLGGLEAIILDCRTSDVETLRHCATALANLALFGGPENQLNMIKNNSLMWLFHLAFHNDDIIRYFACLSIAALVANKEIEAEVLRSGNLNLVESFVLSQNPEEFSRTALCHLSHGQSKNWLVRLVPVLNSDRVEAQSLAAFHFAMEASIKKKQDDTKIFYEIGAIEALKRVASSPNAIASRLAAQALHSIGEVVPHKLIPQVPLWSVEDVREWVKQIGFSNFSNHFVNSRVDGDILLQLDENMLREDIEMKNGILRRRFLRELNFLKSRTDYSSCDSSNLNSVLQMLGPEFQQYTYRMLQSGIQRSNLRHITEEHLLKDCGVANSIHRLRILQTIKGLDLEEESESADQKNLDVFVSYRRSNGSQLASLLKVHLQLRGFSVFIDVERLEAGKFDNNLLNSIRQAKHFLLVLTPNALDRCVGDGVCKDWVHKEISEALRCQCNIIPILDNFQWPETDLLPEDIRAICYFNGIRWIHDYQDACVDKLERFLKGERGDLKPFGTPSTPSTCLSKTGPYFRSSSNESTKDSLGSDVETVEETPKPSES